PRRPALSLVSLGLLRWVEAAGRLHDKERAGKPLTANVLLDLAEVSTDDRADIGVGDDGRAALELAIFLGQFMRGGNEHIRVIPLENRLRARLVLVPG